MANTAGGTAGKTTPAETRLPAPSAHEPWTTRTSASGLSTQLVLTFLDGKPPIPVETQAVIRDREAEELERSRNLIKAGLGMPSCQLPKDAEVIPALRRAKDVMALLLLEAEEGRSSKELSTDLGDLMTMGSRFGRCKGGGVLVASIGQAIWDDPTLAATRLADLGHIDSGDLKTLALRAEGTRLKLDDVLAAADVERTGWKALLEPMSGVDGRIWDEKATHAMIDAYFVELKNALKNPEPGWDDRFDEKHKNLLSSDEDQRWMKALGPAAGSGSMQALAAAALELKGDPPPNLIGRLSMRALITTVSHWETLRIEVEAGEHLAQGLATKAVELEAAGGSRVKQALGLREAAGPDSAGGASAAASP